MNIYNPTDLHMEQIHDWLEIEFNQTGEGFFNNWSIIEGAYSDGDLICYEYQNVIAGLIVATSTNLGPIVILDIMVIHPSYREMGLGSTMLKEFIDYLVSKDCFAVRLMCNPPSSETFWRKNHFVDFPTNYSNSRQYVQLYRIIANSKLSNSNNAPHRFELWNKTAFSPTTSNPMWSWEIEIDSKSRKLIKPIIFPCNKNWKCRVIENNSMIYEGNIAYYEGPNITKFGFLIIEEWII